MHKRVCHKILLKGVLILSFSTGLLAQRSEIAFLGGLTNYLGDLQHNPFSMPNTQGVFSVLYKYPVSSNFWMRAALTNGKLTAKDANNIENLKLRNLSFETQITDGYIAAEYRLFKEEKASVIPYAFGGLGFFHFNPFIRYGAKNEKVFLRPLGTEGQGLPEYPEKKMYNLTQLMLPVGGGILWHATERWTLGVEIRNNFTFTDYIDDVSTKYALQAPLLRDRGQLAVDVAWRTDEINGGPYPNSERTRGNPSNNDWYYLFGFYLGVKLPSANGQSAYQKAKNQLGCPKW